MPEFNQNSLAAIQPDLMPNESILWAGQPSGRVIFHREDMLLIPFSLLWGGFAIFWEAGVTGFVTPQKSNAPWFFVFWGIPFVLVGQYLIWGRFLYAAWLKARTHYAVTNRRVIVVQNGWSRKFAATYIESLPTLVKEGGTTGIGILRFAPAPRLWSTGSGKNRGWGAWNGMTVGEIPTFMDIPDVDYVYRLVSDQREKLKGPKSEFQGTFAT
jgi:hypothetical protein